jgi:hypothetical protein
MTANVRPRVFLLSPANAGGERARMILSDRAQFALARQLRREGLPLGEVFAFVSGLYFRGKLAYSQAFASPPRGAPASLVITQSRGLVPPETSVTIDDLRAMAAVPIDGADSRYIEPLARDAGALAKLIGDECAVILLGSVASTKYIEPLLDIFGQRLLFPADFIGRGDMSRGGLMLRCARSGVELNYVPALGAVRRGARPPRLPKIRRVEP